MKIFIQHWIGKAVFDESLKERNLSTVAIGLLRGYNMVLLYLNPIKHEKVAGKFKLFDENLNF